MPYGRRRRYRSRIRRRFRRKPRRITFARDRVRTGRRMRGFARRLGNLAEKKVARQEVPAATDLNNNGRLIGVYNLSQGTTRSTRIGSKVFFRYATLFGYIDEAFSGSQLIRMSVVWPRRADMAIGDTPTNNYTQPWDLEKWTVISDKLIPLGSLWDPAGAGSVANQSRPSQLPFKKRIKIFKTAMYDGVATQPQTPLPFFFFWCDSTANFPKLHWTFSVTYTDV